MAAVKDLLDTKNMRIWPKHNFEDLASMFLHSIIYEEVIVIFYLCHKRYCISIKLSSKTDRCAKNLTSCFRLQFQGSATSVLFYPDYPLWLALSVTLKPCSLLSEHKVNNKEENIHSVEWSSRVLSSSVTFWWMNTF